MAGVVPIERVLLVRYFRYLGHMIECFVLPVNSVQRPIRVPADPDGWVGSNMIQSAWGQTWSCRAPCDLEQDHYLGAIRSPG